MNFVNFSSIFYIFWIHHLRIRSFDSLLMFEWQNFQNQLLQLSNLLFLHHYYMLFVFCIFSNIYFIKSYILFSIALRLCF
jgi:hypothetical protein